MEHGNFKVLMQPAELVIIFGAAVGTVVIANPLPTLIKIGKGLAGVFGGSKFTKALYLESLKMLYELFALSRKAGTAKLEEEVDNPSKGVVFTKYPKFVKDASRAAFPVRHAAHGGLGRRGPDGNRHHDGNRSRSTPSRIRQTDRRVRHHGGCTARAWESWRPCLGVVLTMGALGGPKEAIGEKVAAALVGTFLGILLCYGIFGPLAVGDGQRIAKRSPNIWASCAWRRSGSSRT